FQFWLLPSPRVIEDPPLILSWSSLFLAGLILVGFAGLTWKARSPLLRFMIFLTALTLLAPMAPISLFFAVDQIRLYLPLVGLSYILAISLDRLLRWGEPKLRRLKPVL